MCFNNLTGLLALLLVASSALATGVDDDTWDWNRTRTWALISWADALTPEQATFLATRYDIVGLGGLFGYQAYEQELGEAAAAHQLKAINPEVKIMVYRNTELYIGDSLAAGHEFEKHPEWRLHNVTGQPVGSFFDLTNEGCRNWFINSTVNAITNYTNGSAIDGVFLDGSGSYGYLTGAKLEPGKADALNVSHSAMLAELTSRLHAIRPGMLGSMGNGAVLDNCGWNGTANIMEPCAQNLDALDGVCGEHFGAFNDVNTTSGNFDGAEVEKWAVAMDAAAAASKVRLYKAWPGPIGLYSVNGTIKLTWKEYVNGTVEPWDPSKNPMTTAEKKANGAIALDWALAAYLLTAGPGSYFSYAWWYQMDTGYVPCPLLPAHNLTCSCPDDWYPDLLRPTGKPLGARQLVPAAGSGHVWTREFQRVSVRVDLGNFSDVSLAWK